MPDNWWHLKNGKKNNEKVVSLLNENLTVEASQRGHESRPAAVRGLILYPMNALVEDQMSRLRRAVDSNQRRQWFDDSENLSGNGIWIGRYNSSSKISGKLVKNSNGMEVNDTEVAIVIFLDFNPVLDRTEIVP